MDQKTRAAYAAAFTAMAKKAKKKAERKAQDALFYEGAALALLMGGKYAAATPSPIVAPTLNKVGQVREYFRANPTASNAEAIAALPHLNPETVKTQMSQMRAGSGKPPKERGNNRAVRPTAPKGAAVWELADKLCVNGEVPVAEMVEAGGKLGMKVNQIKIEYYWWRKFHAPPQDAIAWPTGVDTSTPVAYVWEFCRANLGMSPKLQKEALIGLGLNDKMVNTQVWRVYHTGDDKQAWLDHEKELRDEKKAALQTKAGTVHTPLLTGATDPLAEVVKASLSLRDISSEAVGGIPIGDEEGEMGEGAPAPADAGEDDIMVAPVGRTPSWVSE